MSETEYSFMLLEAMQARAADNAYDLCIPRHVKSAVNKQEEEDDDDNWCQEQSALLLPVSFRRARISNDIDQEDLQHLSISRKKTKRPRLRDRGGGGEETPIQSRITFDESDTLTSLIRLIPKGDWLRERVAEDTVSHRDPPNKRFSCTQYTDAFVEWTNRVTAFLEMQSPIVMQVGDAENADILIPGDGRCTGCRRFYWTSTPSKLKQLAYYECECGVKRASHCTRCRVIQWALSRSEATACLGIKCNTAWELSDLFTVAVTRRRSLPTCDYEAEETHSDLST